MSILFIQVLQPTSQWIPPARIENILKELTLDNDTQKHDDEKTDIVTSNIDDRNDANTQHDTKRRNISIIVEELQRELERPHMDVSLIKSNYMQIRQ